MKNIIVHLFFPNESNNHRSRAIQLDFLLFYILFFLVFQGSITLIKHLKPGILGFATDIKVEKLLVLTNQKRQEAGLSPLKLDPQLSQAAQNKAADMFGKNYWAHMAPDGGTPWDFIVKTGYRYLYAGENLAKDFDNSDGVVTAWMNSSTHRDNILKPEYRDIGFAVVNGTLKGEETTLVVQMFGTRYGEYLAENRVQSVSKEEVQRLPLPTLTPIPQTPTPTIYLAYTNSSIAIGQGKKTSLLMINKSRLMRESSFFLGLFLMAILIVDGFLVWQKKTVRLSGHNLAHLIFLGSVLGALWLTSSGVIL